VACNGRVFIKPSEAVRRPAVGCIVWLDLLCGALKVIGNFTCVTVCGRNFQCFKVLIAARSKIG